MFATKQCKKKKGSICNQDSFATTALPYILLGALAALCPVRVLPFSLEPAAPLASLHRYVHRYVMCAVHEASVYIPYYH